MVEEDGRVPLLDVGTVAQIRAGRIKVRSDIASFGQTTVTFTRSSPEPFDAVILATGFRPDLRALLRTLGACSAIPARLSSAADRPPSPASFSAAQSRLRPDNCARSDLKRFGSPTRLWDAAPHDAKPWVGRVWEPDEAAELSLLHFERAAVEGRHHRCINPFLVM